MESRSNRWRLIRKTFRWCRTLMLFLVFVVIFAGIYFNSLGLPEFLKRPLLAHLQEKGWQVQFRAMRWHFYRGVVLEQPVFNHTNQLLKFSADEAALHVRLSQLKNRRLELTSFSIENGRISHAADANAPALQLSGIETRIRFRSQDVAQIETSLRFQNLRIRLDGTVTNWATVLSAKPRDGEWNDTPVIKWTNLVSALDRFQFSEPPELKVIFNADFRDLQSARASVSTAFSHGKTPWGKLSAATLRAEASPRPGPLQWEMQVSLAAASAETAFGQCKNLSCHATVLTTNNVDWESIDASLSMNHLNLDHELGKTRARLQAATARAQAFLTPSGATNGLPVITAGNLQLLRGMAALMQGNTTRSADLPEVQLQFAYDSRIVRSVTNTYDPFGLFALAQPLSLHGSLRLANVRTPEGMLERFAVAGDWNWPVLRMSQLSAELHGGSLRVTGELDTTTGLTQARFESDLDLGKMQALPEAGRRLLAKWSFDTPPVLKGGVRFQLPADRNDAPWQEHVFSTLEFEGSIASANCSYGPIEILSASTDVRYSNSGWELLNVKINAEGINIASSLRSDSRAGTFMGTVEGSLDPRPLREMFPIDAHEIFDALHLANPASIEARVSGNWTNADALLVEAELSVANSTFRGVDIDALRAAINYTNHTLCFKDVEVRRGDRKINAPEIRIDLDTRRISFRSVHSTIDPMLVVTCIGQEAVDAIAPFRFAIPPAVDVNGGITAARANNADLVFVVEGDQFSWGPFRAEHASGIIHWLGDTMVFTNGHAMGYGGEATGAAFFDFSPKGRADYRFQMDFSEVNVQSLLLGLGRTNHVEGVLDGNLAVTSADMTGFESWQGYGVVRLSDGLIWDIPVFGVFSPLLDAIAPGVGRSRARKASASFVITNGVAWSDDLEIRASTVRMQYRGSVDSRGRIDARVEAEILRDAWLIGRVVSLALSPVTKLFEYKVHGSISEPKTQPVYVPRFLMMALRPFHTLKNLLPEKEKESTDGP